MVELAQANGIKVVLASVLPSTKFEWRRALGDRSEMIVELNRRIKALASQKDVPYLDYHSAMKNDQNGMDPDLAEDGVHPTLKGYKLMEELAKKTVEKLFK